MSDEPDFADWFPEDMTDEAACAIHLFLEEFSRHFQERYYGQIRAQIERLIDDGREQQADLGSITDDDMIPF